MANKDESFKNMETLAAGLRRPGEVGFELDPEYAKMSKRERKRYVKKVHKELDRELAGKRSEIRDARAAAKEAERTQAKSAAEVTKKLKERSAKSDKLTAEQRRRRDNAKNVVDAIGYNRMFENGICEVEDGYYSETLSFDDITYQNARDDDQKTILAAMCDIYNYFPADTTVQFSVVNTPLRHDQIRDRQFYDPSRQANDVLKEDAETMNEVLSDKLAEGVSNIKRSRYMTIGIHANNPIEARTRFSRINTDLTGNFEQIRCDVTPMTGLERLSVLQSLLRPDRKFTFDYERDLSIYSPDSSKDFIAPMSINFKPDGSNMYFKVDDKYCQVLVMRKYDSPLEDTVVANLVNMSMPIEVTWYLQPMEKSKAINFVKTRRAWIDAETIEEQKKAVQQGYDYSILPSELRYSREETEDLLTQLQGQQQHLFMFSGLIYTWAESPEKLTEQVLQILDVASSAGVQVETLEYRQRQGLNSILPLGLNHIEISRPFTTSEACIFVPFATQELEQEGGSWYYQNKLSNNLVFGNRANLASPVGFISGKTGSGKGFFAKNEIEGTLLSKPDDQVIIFDRAGEYKLLVEHAGGTYASFGVGLDAHLNPLGMDKRRESEDFGTQVAFKADAMIAQAAAAANETMTVFSEEERSIIQRCVENIFRRYNMEGGREPILEDFYEELKRQPEPMAQNIALRYERFVSGYSNFFNHATDIDLTARTVGLNFKDVPDSMLVFALISFCETVRNIMYSNFDHGRRTWLYIEEMESLFKYPSVLNYFRRFANECRKFGMYLTGITQSTESMIRNQDANAIVKNSDFIMLLKQSKEDRDYWADALGLSPLEVACIDEGAPRGWGLLVFGSARVPIKGEFPTDNHLYELFSTDPNEWAEKKAREALDAAKHGGTAENIAPQDEFRRRKRVRGRKKKRNEPKQGSQSSESGSDV